MSPVDRLNNSRMGLTHDVWRLEIVVDLALYKIAKVINCQL